MKNFMNALYGIAVRDGKINLQSTLAELNMDDTEPVTVQVVKTGITPPLATSGRFWGAEMERLHHARRLHAQQ